MPRTDDRLGGNEQDRIKFTNPFKVVRSSSGRHKGSGAHRSKKGSKGRGRGGKGSKGNKGTTVKHAPKAGTWREQSGAASAAGSVGTGSSGVTSQAAKESASVLHPSGTGMAPFDLAADAAHALAGQATGVTGHAGLAGVILELVGEGTLTVGGMLAAWARESERITNRTWRRPGGLAKLGGL